jgi:hypothetical protein
MDERVLTEVAEWLTRYAAGVEQVKSAAESVIRGIWASLDDWYDEPLVASLASEAAEMSLASQQTVAGATSQYVSTVTDLLSDKVHPIPSDLRLPPVRRGADLKVVHSRPAEEYRRAIATGHSPDEALNQALGRAGGLAVTDLSLTQRQTQDRMMQALGVTQYRRVVRPELSKSGTCGLCIAASDRLYSVGTLLPIHPPHCKCVTMPVVDGLDPGRSLNSEDLKRLYTDAGSTKAEDLKRTRYKVNEHGEFGPVIGRAQDSFRGPRSVTLEDDPDRAQRMLDKTLPVLDSLETRAAAGEDVTGPLGYQRELVAKLRRIVDD